jgi:hypothetical protein
MRVAHELRFVENDTNDLVRGICEIGERFLDEIDIGYDPLYSQNERID